MRNRCSHDGQYPRSQDPLLKVTQRVGQGEQITIARAGKPVAMLVPIPDDRQDRKPGGWKGKI